MQQQLSNRCVILLLTCCKTCVHYPQCPFAANNRTMLIRQMRKCIDHVQEILLRQYTANVLGVCTIPATCSATTASDALSLALPPEQFFRHPAATIYRSIPNEQIYFPYFKQPFHFPFYTSSFFDYHHSLDPEYQLKLYNANQANRAGTLLTNENYKLININNLHWPDINSLPGRFPSSLPPTPSSNLNGARQFASNYLPTPPYKDSNLSDPFFDNLDKLRLDNRALTNHLNPNYQQASSKFLPLKHSLSQPPVQENGRCFRQSRFAYPLPKRENQSRMTNYSNSIITNGSSLLTDGLGSRLAELESHQCSPCLPIYTSDLNGSPNHPFGHLPAGFAVNGQPPFLYGQPNMLHHYLLTCQLQNLERQQHQYYDNVFTSAFYDNDTHASKTDQCLTIHNLLCSFEVSLCDSLALNLASNLGVLNGL